MVVLKLSINAKALVKQFQDSYHMARQSPKYTVHAAYVKNPTYDPGPCYASIDTGKYTLYSPPSESQLLFQLCACIISSPYQSLTKSEIQERFSEETIADYPLTTQRLFQAVHDNLDYLLERGRIEGTIIITNEL